MITKPRKGVHKSCEVCNEPFYAPQCHSSRKFCSLTCKGVASQRHPVKECPICQKQFKAKHQNQRCCSLPCSGKWKTMQSEQNNHACVVCGKTFRQTPYKDGSIPMYCSRICMAEDYKTRLSGEGNPAWRGGKWPYKGRFWKKVSKAVLLRDKVCQYCGGTDNLVAHHLIPQRFWMSLETANVMSNLAACCHDCHVRRPEHYWLEVPDEVFDPTLHSKQPMPRTTTGLIYRPFPPCAMCGNPVKVRGNGCCSLACAGKLKWERGKCDDLKGHRPETIVLNSRNCGYCDETFISTYSTQAFCSRACYLAAMEEKTPIIICAYCDKPSKKNPHAIRTSKSGKFFCSDQCRDLHRRKRTILTCPSCGKQFEIQTYRLKGDKVYSCSHHCATQYRKIKHAQGK